MCRNAGRYVALATITPTRLLSLWRLRSYFRSMSEAPPKLTRRQMRVLRQIRSGFCYAISRDVRDRLKSMGLISETRDGLAITDEGLRRIQAGK
jgi:hypothetical protein